MVQLQNLLLLHLNLVSSEDVVHDIMSVLLLQKYFRKHISRCIETNLDLIPDFFNTIEIRQKFCGWICLQELDISATVSSRAFDIIRKIEFAEDENKTYHRGLYPSRFKLCKLCKQLESYGQDLLSFMLNDNYIKFDVKHAIKFLLEKHGLLERTLISQLVTMSATVNGGDLA